MKRLIDIQSRLKAGKTAFNSFGGYKYRSLETILEEVKPLLKEHSLLLNITDEVLMIGTRFYVKATARVVDPTGKLIAESSAFAREEESKKGMDSSQITGSCSSYSRKYAVSALFLIDDSKDADALNVKPEFTEAKLKDYPDSRMKKNEQIWSSMFASGTTQESLIKQIESQFVLNFDQKNQIDFIFKQATQKE